MILSPGVQLTRPVSAESFHFLRSPVASGAASAQCPDLRVCDPRESPFPPRKDVLSRRERRLGLSGIVYADRCHVARNRPRRASHRAPVVVVLSDTNISGNPNSDDFFPCRWNI